MNIKTDDFTSWVHIQDAGLTVATFYGDQATAMRHAVQFVTANKAWGALVTLALKREWTLTKDGDAIELHAWSGDVSVSQASTTVDDLLSAIVRVVMADSPAEVTA